MHGYTKPVSDRTFVFRVRKPEQVAEVRIAALTQEEARWMVDTHGVRNRLKWANVGAVEEVRLLEVVAGHVDPDDCFDEYREAFAQFEFEEKYLRTIEDEPKDRFPDASCS